MGYCMQTKTKLSFEMRRESAIINGEGYDGIELDFDALYELLSILKCITFNEEYGGGGKEIEEKAGL